MSFLARRTSRASCCCGLPAPPGACEGSTLTLPCGGVTSIGCSDCSTCWANCTACRACDSGPMICWYSWVSRSIICIIAWLAVSSRASSAGWFSSGAGGCGGATDCEPGGGIMPPPIIDGSMPPPCDGSPCGGCPPPEGSSCGSWSSSAAQNRRAAVQPRALYRFCRCP